MIEAYEALRDSSDQADQSIHRCCASAHQLESTAAARDALLHSPQGGKRKAYVARAAPFSSDGAVKAISTSRPKALPPVKDPRRQSREAIRTSQQQSHRADPSGQELSRGSPSTSASGGPSNIKSSSSPDIMSPLPHGGKSNSISVPNSRPTSNSALPPSAPSVVSPEKSSHSQRKPPSSSSLLHKSSPHLPLHGSSSNVKRASSPSQRLPGSHSPPLGAPSSSNAELQITLEELLRHHYKGRAGANLTKKVGTNKDWDVALSLLNLQIEDERARHRNEQAAHERGEGEGSKLRLPDIHPKSGGWSHEGRRKQAWAEEEEHGASQWDRESVASDDTDEILSRSRAQQPHKSVIASLQEVKKQHNKGVRGELLVRETELSEPSPRSRFDRVRIEKQKALANLEHEYKAS
jgi:hypothetical protein